jgi:hypothetical protein
MLAAGRHSRRALAALVVAFVCSVPSATGAADGRPALDFPSGFDVPTSLLPRVKLWVEVFGVRSGEEFVSLAQGKVYGRREAFRRSLLRSREHLVAIRERLEEEALPNLLAYLPHVESGFLGDARSHAGAVGLWQIMPDTGRELGLRVDAAEDQRLRSGAATRAAARYLADAFDTLGSWPLAVTAYNYGVGGMKLAAQTVGSVRLDELIAQYGGPAFGNAVKNYYAQFLAAAHVAENVDYYFPELRGDPAFGPFPENGVRRGSSGWRPVPPTWLGARRARPAKALDLLRISAASWDVGPTAWRRAARPVPASDGLASHGAALERLAKSLVLDAADASGLGWSLQFGARPGVPRVIGD